MKSLLLDRTAWDLVLDVSGNIACATEPYSRSQDVACACRLFLRELWYDINKGIPYFSEILGQWPPLSLVRERLTRATLTVPGVISAEVVITGIDGRILNGRVNFVDEDGISNSVAF